MIDGDMSGRYHIGYPMCCGWVECNHYGFEQHVVN